MTEPVFPHHKLETRAVRVLKPYARNARKHSKTQLKQIARSIERFGFTNPVLIGDDNQIIAGHGRIEAAKLLNLETVPVLVLSHLTPAERRTYVIADNKLALNASWDADLLAGELRGLLDEKFEVDLTGFSLAETDMVLQEALARDAGGREAETDRIPPLPAAAVSRPGDVWQLGRHRLLCGDARVPADYETLLPGGSADLVFTDPPYNVPIDGHVGGLGKGRFRPPRLRTGSRSSR